MSKKVNHGGSAVYSSASHGEKPSSWQNPPQGPTLSALSVSQQLFIKLMRHIETAENQDTIEDLKLPLKYTGQTLPCVEVISTATEWSETLYNLLDKIEQEGGRPFADNYLSGLFSYNFIANEVRSSYATGVKHKGSSP